MSAGYATAYSSFDDSTAWWDNLGRLIPHWMTPARRFLSATETPL